jgi:vancomycin resistance protein YoaR
VTVAGAAVGGLDEGRLRGVVEKVRQAAGETRITVSAVGGAKPAVNARETDLGHDVDVERTVQALLTRGRQGNPVRALADRIRARVGAIRMGPVDRIDRSKLSRWVAGAAGALSAPPTEANVTFQGEQVVPIYPRPGLVVDEADIRAAVLGALRSPGPDSVRVAGKPVSPFTTRADTDNLSAAARAALSAPVRLVVAGRPLDIPPSRVAALLVVKHQREGPGPQARLTVDPGSLRKVLGADFGVVDTPAMDARFEVMGPTVRLVPSQVELRLRLEEASDRLAQVLASGGPREAEVPVDVVQPGFSTAQAEALNITRLVAAFTTKHKCCEPRVGNIHRIADMLRGRIVAPGATFSLNEAVGPRTPEQGFVPAPAIREGKFVDEVGGGVSQFSTTLFNAAFLGGYDIVDHQPHVYYIARYPKGRDATLGFPEPDLKIRNDTAAGILIGTSYTDTSITVSLFGSTDVAVRSVTDPPSAFADPETECRPNPQLPPGTSRVVQDGGRGFRIMVQRIRRYPDGREEVDRFSTRYKPEPRIVESPSC